MPQLVNALRYRYERQGAGYLGSLVYVAVTIGRPPAAWQAAQTGSVPGAVDDDLPYPFVNEPVAAAIWLRAMSVQFCVLFRQLSTSQAMTDGLQTFQKSACIEY